MQDWLKTLENGARLAGEKGLTRFTRFLDPAQAVKASELAGAYGAVFSSYGGYDGAERVVGCFHEQGNPPGITEYPVVCLHSRYHIRFCSVSHRDLLGAFMALGLTRSCIGDMIISGEDIYLFAHQTTAPHIAEAMTSAGKASLSFAVLGEVPVMPAPKGSAFSAVVSSLRHDAVLAAAYHLSRSEAADLIRGGAVKVNHLPCERVDVQLAENALLSVKGRGRIRLVSVDGLTKKQRIGITFFRYE